ncbi:DUF1642 domain-containing protein [Enterococcus faecalis]|uniref:DUF1642 domain-containing protein n=1 Tax=Enterococcus faecalis TaxID=1351 RepID=UPI0012E161BD|nr:DUF1642 domain-containing protein [Enterococcus faecalis]MBB6648548.1 DUF1642 domain-containing protein [Enterococcus faecalis]MUN52443.1 DUF1642 domain-containing protein [Enterococcus faecalis]
MNKQEKEDLIQALYDIGGCEAEDEWARGYDEGINAAIEVVKEIKVQGKVVVPRPVAEMIEIYNGYEVEKEQLYYVKLPEIGYMRFGKKYFYSTDKEDAKRYTENQIKAIDERYWPFAVKVDGGE